MSRTFNNHEYDQRVEAMNDGLEAGMKAYRQDATGPYSIISYNDSHIALELPPSPPNTC